MSLGKPSPAPPSSPMFSLRGSLITLAFFTLLSLAYFSVSSSPPAKPLFRQTDRNPSPETESETLSDVYHSPEVFRLNYAEMERKFKVYIYPDGDPKTFYLLKYPVILSNYYDLPFNDILDWRKFAVVLTEKDVYQLKQILKAIPHSEFLTLHKNLVKVQKHFQWNSPPIKYDAFHMVMYDLWLRHHVVKY